MKEIKLTQEKTALVDDEDYEWLSCWKWNYTFGGYALRGTWSYSMKKEFPVRMHRQIMGILHEPKLEIDHIDGNGLNNQRANLRVCTHQQNSYNAKKWRIKSSLYKGVSLTSDGSWIARIKTDGKTLNLGSFKNEKKVAIAYNEAAEKYFKSFAKLNEIKN